MSDPTRAARSERLRKEDAFLARNPDYPVNEHIVDDRTFLLGLDALYRSAIKPHERGELLDCARAVGRVLDVSPANVPIEGYYHEDAALTEYFRLMRALQGAGDRVARVKGMEEYRRLLDVTSSPLYGRALSHAGLLPIGHDPLRQALAEQWPDWTMNRLIARAHDVAVETDDFSLVGLAVLSRDPVVVVALRESVVLYASRMAGADLYPPIERYVWQVDDRIAAGAARFVRTFNRLFGESLPAPIPDNAVEFFDARASSNVVGRCVCIGMSLPPNVRYYHWAVFSRDAVLGVEEFWHSDLRTTEGYQQERAAADYVWKVIPGPYGRGPEPQRHA